VRPRGWVTGVTSFDLDAELTHPLDFLLMQNGPVVLVQDDTGPLQEGLAQLGYDIVELDGGRWSDAAAMHQDLAVRLAFPGYYGRNFAALRDCLRDVATAEYGWTPTAAGLAVALRDFGAFQTSDPATADALLEAAANSARYGLLFGHRLLWLLDVPAGHQPHPIGAFTPTWAYPGWTETG
jgi:hypothetical protein